jgi:amidohydrolase
MLADGLMERFGIQRIFGMHNMPGIPVGQFAINPGPMMAAVAKFTITIEGKGGHAARPYQTRDPIVAAAQLVEALQQVVSRNADPVGSLVVSVTRIAAGTAYNIIPETTEIWGTTRALDMADAKLAQERIAMICEGMGKATGTSITLDYDQAHPVALNDPREAAFAASVARRMVGAHKVDGAVRPSMAGEDFSHMLTARPGAFIFIGNGDSQGLHHPAYDFHDGAIPAGVAYWVGLVEAALPAA